MLGGAQPLIDHQAFVVKLQNQLGKVDNYKEPSEEVSGTLSKEKTLLYSLGPCGCVQSLCDTKLYCLIYKKSWCVTWRWIGSEDHMISGLYNKFSQ